MASHVCRVCEQRPATVHYTEIKDGAATVLDLCEECATKQGMTNPIPSMLSGLLEGAKGLLAAASSTSDLKCPDCGIKFDEFRAKGRLGCPRDYEVFEKELLPLLEKIHGNTKHTGRVPRGQGPDTLREDRLLRLRRDLARAVKGEDYETAARLRDDIKGAEEGLRGPR
jgi:protein arginine kinase activator